MRMYRVVQSRPGVIKLADGAEFILRIAVVGVKNMGFSPFGGVNLVVKTTGGIIALSIPDGVSQYELPHRLRRTSLLGDVEC